MKKSEDKRVTFSEKKHVYKLGKKQLTSVTTYLSQYFSEFNAREIARKLAKFPQNRKAKKGVRYWLRTWKEDAEHGSRVHEMIEKYIKNEVINTESEERDGLKFIQALKYLNTCIDGSFEELTPEVLVYNEELGLAGQIDLIHKYKKGNDTYFDIYDWKTNKAIKKQSYNGKFCKPPFEHLEDCNYTKYMLQLMLYAYMYSQQTGYRIGNLILVHLQENEVVTYNIEYAPELVALLLK